MKTILMQKQNNCWRPYDDDDVLESRLYAENQVCAFRPKTVGVKKLRSYQQLKMCKKLIQIAFDNTDTYKTLLGMSENIKVKLGFIEEIVYIDGVPNFKTKSLSYDKTSTKEANDFTEELIPFVANMLGITCKKLKENSKD